jgi:hypothetical protein
MFKPRAKSEERKRSAATLIKYLLAVGKPEVLATHLSELLTILLWKITEADAPKHRTRFQSQGALRCRDKRKLRHEHVFQRAKMIAALKKAAPRKIDYILQTAIGCTVTIKEHKRLTKFELEYGWKRYRKAGIKVFDLETHARKI